MKIKTTLCVLTLALAPSLALAEGCPQRMKSAAQCSGGQIWDAAKQACVPLVNS